MIVLLVAGWFSLINEKGERCAVAYTSVLQLVREQVCSFISIQPFIAYAGHHPDPSGKFLLTPCLATSHARHEALKYFIVDTGCINWTKHREDVSSNQVAPDLIVGFPVVESIPSSKFQYLKTQVKPGQLFQLRAVFQHRDQDNGRQSTKSSRVSKSARDKDLANRYAQLISQTNQVC